MRKHEGHAGVQEWGCETLRVLAVNADNNKVIIKYSVYLSLVQKLMKSTSMIPHCGWYTT